MLAYYVVFALWLLGSTCGSGSTAAWTATRSTPPARTRTPRQRRHQRDAREAQDHRAVGSALRAGRAVFAQYQIMWPRTIAGLGLSLNMVFAVIAGGDVDASGTHRRRCPSTQVLAETLRVAIQGSGFLRTPARQLGRSPRPDVYGLLLALHHLHAEGHSGHRHRLVAPLAPRGSDPSRKLHHHLQRPREGLTPSSIQRFFRHTRHNSARAEKRCPGASDTIRCRGLLGSTVTFVQAARGLGFCFAECATGPPLGGDAMPRLSAAVFELRGSRCARRLALPQVFGTLVLALIPRQPTRDQVLLSRAARTCSRSAASPRGRCRSSSPSAASACGCTTRTSARNFPISTGVGGFPRRWRVRRRRQRGDPLLQHYAAPRCRSCSASPCPVSPCSGMVTGRPASHGCIRLPHPFAIKLYKLTRLGARVVIAPNEPAPEEIAHAVFSSQAGAAGRAGSMPAAQGHRHRGGQ